MTRHGTHEGFQRVGGTFLHEAPFGSWCSIDEVYLVFHSISTIQRVKQHAKCFSAFKKLCGIFHHDHTLGISVVEGCFNTCRH